MSLDMQICITCICPLLLIYCTTIMIIDIDSDFCHWGSRFHYQPFDITKVYKSIELITLTYISSIFYINFWTYFYIHTHSYDESVMSFVNLLRC